MDEAGAKRHDVIIPLGHRLDSFNNKIQCDYNFSKFIRLYESEESRDFIAKIEKFLHLLDAKVHIKPSDPKYTHIYQGIDIIVKRVVAELAKLDPLFDEVTLRQTGSIISNVKVGLPHESDYVMEMPRDRRLKTGKSVQCDTLFPLVSKIVTDKATTLTEGLAYWVIHGVEAHSQTGGVCIAMQCLAIENDSTSDEVGVTVDLVPVYLMETTRVSLNKKAESLLPQSLGEYAKRGELYKLVADDYYEDDDDDDYCDTGFIENSIIKQLPEDTKRAYRVLKFLISNLTVSDFIPFNEIKFLYSDIPLRLYGRKPLMASYTFRVFFIHLLLHVHGTAIEHQIKGGVLVLCLLDMLKSQEHNTFAYALLDHALIKGRSTRLSLLPILEQIDDLFRRLKRDNPADIAEEFYLLNNKSKVNS